MSDIDEEKQRVNVQLVDTADLLTRDELRELKALANYAKALRWLITGFVAAGSFFGLDRIQSWFKD